jgi:hypothetical protein
LQAIDNNTILKGIKKIDFTCSLDGFKHISKFGSEFIELVRTKAPQTLIIVDSGFGFKNNVVHTVSDHINLTGDNPLVGPNDPIGERFPIVQGIYVPELLPDLPKGIAGGLASGIKPTEQELSLIRSLGVDFCCYNLVPAMLIAAHAKCKVLGIVVPEKQKLDNKIIDQIMSLT